MMVEAQVAADLSLMNDKANVIFFMLSLSIVLLIMRYTCTKSIQALALLTDPSKISGHTRQSSATQEAVAAAVGWFNIVGSGGSG